MPRSPTAEAGPSCAATALAKRASWLRRIGSPRSGFRYVDRHGRPIRSRETLERIRSLVIPPRWRNVLIAPSPRSRVQVVGIDALGRVQYRYHPAFLARQQTKKYEKLLAFAQQLPRLRERTNADIRAPGFGRDRVLAIVVRLINELYFRVGCERNVRRYRTFGITTLRNRHLVIRSNGTLEFSFVGKHHIRVRRVLVDERLAELMRQLKRIRGRRLFQYMDAEGAVHPIRPCDVNGYIQSATGDGFSAKDFRTWGGTLNAAVALAEIGPAPTKTAVKRNIVRAIRRVSERLGNTPAVCRSSYIHPSVLELYATGVTLDAFRPRGLRRITHTATRYDPEEVALIALLETAREASLGRITAARRAA